MSDKALELALEAKGVVARADAEGRELSSAEREYVEGLLDQAGREKSRQQLDMLGREIGAPGGNTTAGVPFTADDPGTRFINSEGYKAIADPARRSERWTTGMIPVTDGPWMTKGTLLEGSGSPGSGTGGGLVPVPQVVPGVVDKLFQPLVLESLLAANQATGNTVRYITEGTATSAAAGVAEGGLKPESTLGLSTIDEPIKKIATTITASDEILQDATVLQPYINGRLALFVQIEAERQLFRGTSGGNEVQGILTSRSVPVFTGGTADDKSAQIFKAMNSMRGSAFIEPEWVVIHPTDWQLIRLRQDTTGQYLGGGPFLGSYGNPTMAATSSQVTTAVDSLWGKSVYVTAAIGGAGTALIGTRANASVYSRGGVNIEITNSHASLFTSDLVAVRCERRLGLAMFRSGGYVECRLAVGPGG